MMLWKNRRWWNETQESAGMRRNPRGKMQVALRHAKAGRRTASESLYVMIYGEEWAKLLQESENGWRRLVWVTVYQASLRYSLPTSAHVMKKTKQVLGEKLDLINRICFKTPETYLINFWRSVLFHPYLIG